MWAVTCVGYFGFLRAREFTMSSPFLEDIAVDSRTAIRLLLRRAKTNPFGKGMEIFLGSSGTKYVQSQHSYPVLPVSPPPGSKTTVCLGGQ